MIKPISHRAFANKNVLLLIVIFLCTIALSSQEKTKKIKMGWKPVIGALGYQVQIRDGSNNVVLDKRTQTSNITISIVPGKYQRRIAAINKFNKVGKWTTWKKFTILAIAKPNIRNVIPDKKATRSGAHKVTIYGKNFMKRSRVFIVLPGKSKQEIPFEYISRKKLSILLNTAQLRDGNYTINIVNPKGLQDSKRNSVAIVKNKVFYDKRKVEKEISENESFADASGDFWPTLIPGMPGFQRGDGSGYAWTGIIGTALVLSYLEYDAASIKAQQIASDPLYILFNEPGFLLVTAQRLTTSDLLFLSMVSDFRRNKIERKFLAHRRNQMMWNSVAAGTIATHFIWENKEYMRMSHLVPGWTHYKQNRAARGNAWIASMGLVAAGLGYTNTAIKKNKLESESALSDIFYSKFAMDSVLGVNSSRDSLLLLNSLSTKNQLDSQVLSQQNMANNLSFSFLALYLFQMVDATYVQRLKPGISSFKVNIRNEYYVTHEKTRTRLNSKEQIHEIEWTYSF